MVTLTARLQVSLGLNTGKKKHLREVGEKNHLLLMPARVSGAHHLQHQTAREEGAVRGPGAVRRPVPSGPGSCTASTEAAVPQLGTCQMWSEYVGKSPLRFWKRHFGPG